MKKFLSLVLALVMTMSLVTVAGAADFADADKVNYDAAVDVISELGIVGGYADGSFNPNGTLTRQAAAKIICNINVGPDAAADLAAATAPFVDVAANNQFAGYIAYCVNAGLISGYGDGTFGPANTLTGYAFLKMLLTSIGYDQTAEGYVGANAQVNILLDAKAEGLLAGFDGKFNPAKAITREEACLFALNALDVETVSYKDNGSNIVIGDIQITTGKVLDESRGDKLAAKADFDLEKKEDGKNAADALGRPAYSWYVDGEKVGTYAQTADIVIENAMDQDDLDDLFEDLTWKTTEVKAADTKNGKTIEIFVNDDDEITDAVAIEAKLLKVGTVKADKKATKDDDERYVTFAGKVVTADKDVTKGTEIANFEAVYAAADEDKENQWFLVVFDAEGEVFSVEIPETVEAKITRVKGSEIVAGGETYKVACAASVSKEAVELTVGANGVVYAIEGTTADELSDVIYVDACYETSTKWGKVINAQIVNEENEIVEIVVDDEYAAGFYTYEINDDDEYELTKATLVGKDTVVEDDDTYVKVDGKNYFADDMTVVYISGTKGDLEVVVKEGAQNVTAAHIILAGDDKDVQTIYVLGEYKADNTSDDYLYIADTSVVADVIDDDGNAAKTYNAYIDGQKVEIMISNVKAGFWTYEIDEKTGVYKLVEGSNDYLNETIEISKGKYVSVGTIDDATVTGEIIDLTDEGLYTLSDIDAWDGDAVVVSFLYDKDENEITALFVDFA